MFSNLLHCNCTHNFLCRHIFWHSGQYFSSKPLLFSLVITFGWKPFLKIHHCGKEWFMPLKNLTFLSRLLIGTKEVEIVKNIVREKMKHSMKCWSQQQSTCSSTWFCSFHWWFYVSTVNTCLKPKIPFRQMALTLQCFCNIRTRELKDTHTIGPF